MDRRAPQPATTAPDRRGWGEAVRLGLVLGAVLGPVLRLAAAPWTDPLFGTPEWFPLWFTPMGLLTTWLVAAAVAAMLSRGPRPLVWWVVGGFVLVLVLWVVVALAAGVVGGAPGIMERGGVGGA
jgi:hypothetical protein